MKCVWIVTLLIGTHLSAGNLRGNFSDSSESPSYPTREDESASDFHDYWDFWMGLNGVPSGIALSTGIVAGIGHGITMWTDLPIQWKRTSKATWLHGITTASTVVMTASYVLSSIFGSAIDYRQFPYDSQEHPSATGTENTAIHTMLIASLVNLGSIALFGTGMCMDSCASKTDPRAISRGHNTMIVGGIMMALSEIARTAGNILWLRK